MSHPSKLGLWAALSECDEIYDWVPDDLLVRFIQSMHAVDDMSQREEQWRCFMENLRSKESVGLGMCSSSMEDEEYLSAAITVFLNNRLMRENAGHGGALFCHQAPMFERASSGIAVLSVTDNGKSCLQVAAIEVAKGDRSSHARPHRLPQLEGYKRNAVRLFSPDSRGPYLFIGVTLSLQSDIAVSVHGYTGRLSQNDHADRVRRFAFRWLTLRRDLSCRMLADVPLV